MRIWLPYKVWEGFYAERAPYQLVFTLPDGSTLSFATKAKQWEALRRQYQELFAYMRLNRP